MTERIEVRQTWHYGGTQARYRLCVQPYNYYLMSGPYAGPYVRREEAQTVADRLNAQLRGAAGEERHDDQERAPVPGRAESEGGAGS